MPIVTTTNRAGSTGSLVEKHPRRASLREPAVQRGPCATWSTNARVNLSDMLEAANKAWHGVKLHPARLGRRFPQRCARRRPQGRPALPSRPQCLSRTPRIRVAQSSRRAMPGGDGLIRLSTRRRTSFPGRRRQRFLATITGSQRVRSSCCLPGRRSMKIHSPRGRQLPTSGNLNRPDPSAIQCCSSFSVFMCL